MTDTSSASGAEADGSTSTSPTTTTSASATAGGTTPATETTAAAAGAAAATGTTPITTTGTTGAPSSPGGTGSNVSAAAMSSRIGQGWNSFVRGIQTSVSQAQEKRKKELEAKEIGKIYDPAQKKWVFYFLQHDKKQLEEELEKISEQEKLEKQGAAGSSPEEEDSKKVRDTAYYDLLGVSPSADDGQLRKAYFVKARRCHPDKNPDDPEAHDKFQKLGHAYQVLSNPQRRAAYDRHGPATSDNAAEHERADMDPLEASVFFNVMFGSSWVEPYIGTLWIATTSDSVLKEQDFQQVVAHGVDGGDDGDADPNSILSREERDELLHRRMKLLREKGELQQKIRQVTCALNLQERVSGYDDDDPATFADAARAEAEANVGSAYGTLYLRAIGSALKLGAEEYLGRENSFLGIAGHLARTQKQLGAVGSNFQLLGAGIKAAAAGSRTLKQAEKLQQQLQEQQDGATGATSASAAKDAGAAEKKDESAGTASAGAAGVETAAAAAAGGEGADDIQLQQQMAESIDESLPAFLELAWAVNKRDIQGTLHEVCAKLFRDASIPKEMRAARARAVRILGQEFLSVARRHSGRHGASKNHFDPEDIKARVAVASMTTLAKAQGQEVSDADHEEMIQQAKVMSMSSSFDEATAGGAGAAANDHPSSSTATPDDAGGTTTATTTAAEI